MSMSTTAIDFAAINQAALSNPAYIESLLPDAHYEGVEGNRRLHCGTLSGGAGRSFNLNTETGKWYDQQSGEGGGDVISLVAAQQGIGQGEAARLIAEDLHLSTPVPAKLERKSLPECPINWNSPTFRYDYLMPVEGQRPKREFVVLRWEKPGFKKAVRRSLGTGPDGAYIKHAKGAEMIPYNLCGSALEPRVDRSQFVVIVEGENKVDRLLTLGICASCNPGGAGKWEAGYNHWFEGKDIVILPDNDEPGRKHAEDVARNLHGVAASVKVCELPGLPEKGDVVDWLEMPGNDKERLQALMNDAPYWKPAAENGNGLSLIDMESFTAMSIANRDYIMYPVLPERGTAMLFAYRGTGKTYFALTMAYAVACGCSLFNIVDGPQWFAKKPRKVLYVDGEMPAQEMQDRLRKLQAMEMKLPAPDFFRVCSFDMLPYDMPTPNLASEDGQKMLEAKLDGVELLVLDNIATLFPRRSENTAESWMPIQKWLLALRRRSITVLLVHHAGKNGEQRDSSSKEDILDTSIKLRRPEDYMMEDGARFVVELTKARAICGTDALPFEASLSTTNGKIEWLARLVDDDNMQAVIDLAKNGKSERAIAKELGISDSKVHRLKAKAKASGRL